MSTHHFNLLSLFTKFSCKVSTREVTVALYFSNPYLQLVNVFVMLSSELMVPLSVV